MRTPAILALLLAAPALAGEPDCTDQRCRARAVLALEAAKQGDPLRTKAKAALLESTGCGACMSDLPAAEAAAEKSGRPLVIFVGGCGGRGQVAAASGGVPVRVREYGGSTLPRVFVYTKHPQLGWCGANLPADASPETIAAAVKDAAKK